MKYRRLPKEVEAVQWIGTNFEDVVKFLGYNVYRFSDSNFLVLPAKDGNTMAKVGDFLVKDASWRTFPISEEEFLANYEEVI